MLNVKRMDTIPRFKKKTEASRQNFAGNEALRARKDVGANAWRPQVVPDKDVLVADASTQTETDE